MYIIYKKNKPTHTHTPPHNYELPINQIFTNEKKMNLTYKKKHEKNINYICTKVE